MRFWLEQAEAECDDHDLPRVRPEEEHQDRKVAV